MTEMTLEMLTKRVEKIEQSLLRPREPQRKDWRRTIGMFASSDFMKVVDEEARKIREADREAGRNKSGSDEES